MLKNIYKKIVRMALSPVLNPIEKEVKAINKNLNFLIDNSLDVSNIQPKPSVKSIQIELFEIFEKMDAFFVKKAMNYFFLSGIYSEYIGIKSLFLWNVIVNLGWCLEIFCNFSVFESWYKPLLKVR